jgi:hypothetical protein
MPVVRQSCGIQTTTPVGSIKMISSTIRKISEITTSATMEE